MAEVKGSDSQDDIKDGEKVEKTELPQEHKSLDYLLAQIPRKAQKGVLTQCDLILTCVDATQEYIILGTNVGLLFLYDRKKEIVERLRTSSNSDVIVCVSLHSGLEHQVAAGTHKGLVYIFQLPSVIPGQNKKLQQFIVKDMHKSKVTCITWSRNGMKVFSGDDSGIIVCTEFDAYQGHCKSLVMLIEGGSEIVQLNHDHKALLVSTKHRSFVYRTDIKDALAQVGQKERKITGNFGACFIPSLCKPEDAQLYAVRPGMRVWKAEIGGAVKATYLFKELIKNPHPEIQIRAFDGVNSFDQMDQNFGPLYQYMEKYLVTWNETGLFILNPGGNCVIGSQRRIGSLVDVSITKDEIFVLRKNTSRNLIRIALYPESKGDSLYHRLISEREKFALMKKPKIPEEEQEKENHANKSSPLQFIQGKLKSLDVLGNQGKGNKPVENLLSSIDKMNLGDSEEVTDHELDHSAQMSHDHIVSQSDSSPVIKRENSGNLPPVLRLESPDLLTVELFSGYLPGAINSVKQNSLSSPRTERFNPFLKDDLSEDIDVTIEVNTAELKPRGGGMVTSGDDSSLSLDLVKPVVKEERLLSVVEVDSASDDIVFKSKKHKKRKKGTRHLDRANSDKDNVSLLSLEGVTGSPDSMSIASETSDDISLSMEYKAAGASDSSENASTDIKTNTEPESHKGTDKTGKSGTENHKSMDGKAKTKTKESDLKIDIDDNISNERYSKIEKSLEEFEKSIPGLSTNTAGFTSSENVSENNSTESNRNSDTSNVSAQAAKAEQDNDVKGKLPVLLEKNDSFISIYSQRKYRSPQINEEKSPDSLTNEEAALSKDKSPSSTSDASGDDFYKKYASTPTSSISSPVTDVQEHPLAKSEEELEDKLEENTESVKSSDNVDDIPSCKLINNWTEVYTSSNIECLAMSDNHIWYVDRSCYVYYSSLHGPGLKWHRTNGYAKQIAVSKSGHILWRLYNNIVYAASKVTVNKPEGIKWLEALKEVQSISVDNTSAWYIKVNGDVMFQKGLSKDRPCFKSYKVPCDFQLRQIKCYNGVVWAIDDSCQLVYREGITKHCPEGKSWSILPSCTSNEILFSSVTFGDGNIAWAVDILGRIWFMNSVTKETPLGDGIWYQVPISEILVQDKTAIDALRSLAKKFDPQKLAKILTTQQGGVITAGTGGIWVCLDHKHVIQVCRGSIEGHHWGEYHIMGIASSVAWKLISASSSDHDYGVVWAAQPNGEIFAFTSDSRKCIAVSKPRQHCHFSCISTCRDAMWGLTHEGKVYIRSGISSHDPQGVEWVSLDLMQLGDAHLISIACSTLNVWAVDSDGIIYQRIGVKAPSSHSLNPAWLPVDMSSSSGTAFSQIAAGPNDYMVWAIDNRRQVYTRVGITDDMPIGKSWLHVPGTPAMQLAVSEKHVWALNPSGEILCRYGITPANPGGDYWRKIPGVFAHISVSPKDQLWAISSEGQIFHRKSKFVIRKRTMDDRLFASSSRKSKTSTSSDDGWELI